jgi:hypothetical protein
MARCFETSLRRTRWRTTIVLAVSCLILAALLILFCSRQQRTRVASARYAWVQLMPDEPGGKPGGRLIRAIVAQDDVCPALTEGDRTVAMRGRPSPARAAFPVLVCEAELEADSPARLAGRTLPTRAVEPNDIVVMGDTGCRMTYYDQKQSCLDGKEWPFRRNAASAADKVSRGQSFVLHLGDFHYREHPCADSSATCGGSPYGDNWETWQSEFFEPADPLLRAAPWVIMRGNHENCERAGAGWLYFFALPGHKSGEAACDSEPRGYSISIGKTKEPVSRPRVLLVLDTSDEQNPYKIEQRCEQYEQLLKPLDESGPEFWLALHQPLWGRMVNGREQDSAASEPAPCKESESAISIIREKFLKLKSDRLARVVFAGDTHAFQFFFPKTASTPIQIIAGNGGTALDTLCEAADVKATDAKCRAKSGNDRKYRHVPSDERVSEQNTRSFGIEGSSLTFVQHGFTVMHREDSTWTATEFDSDGRFIVACRFSELTAREESANGPPCDVRS